MVRITLLRVALAVAVLMFASCEPEAPKVISAKPVVKVSTNPTLNPDLIHDAVNADTLDSGIVATNFSEDLILKLTPRIQEIARSFSSSDVSIESWFESMISYRGPAALSMAEVPATDGSTAALGHVTWPTEEEFVQVEGIEGQLWKTLLDVVEFIDGKFGVKKGSLDLETKVFTMTTAFEGKVRLKDGRVGGLKSVQNLQWAFENDDWKIVSWEQTETELLVSQKTIFNNVTEKVVGSKETYDQIVESKHRQWVLERASNHYAIEGLSLVRQYFSDWMSLFHYPSPSVVDVDNDGWDDLFFTARTGSTLLLRNQGDGTFKDETEKFGLKMSPAFANCALFADFDNDGDKDLFLGCSQQPSLFFRNEDGKKFVPDEAVNKKLYQVRFISSGAVGDFNRDGLLDIYLSTYATRGGSDFNWVEYAVRPHLRNKMIAKVSQSHSFIDRHGPPNILLVNTRGDLEPYEIPENLELWRNSFQAVWSDVDNDGDQDLYVCNDFAPDAYFRNETERGSKVPFFIEETSTRFDGNTMGFGMGASFGDYNSDGKLDLYVSNMYSKAGQRVIGNFDGDVDPRISISAKGNFLYEKNDEGKFEHVGGLEPGKQQVSKVGWSFGGQFADFNNDGKLDLYVPSGFFTAPDSVAEKVDL